MNTQQKIEKLKSFENEREFREFLIDFLKKSGFSDVIHTHRYGAPEQGKDIIAKFPHSLEGDDWYAFVVKLGRIGGGTNEIETIKNQIKQSFEYPYVGPDGSKLKVNKVKVVTNENFTNGAQSQLSDSPELKIYNNFNYWWGETLIPLIDKNYSDYWLPGDAFAKEYSKAFTNQLNAEIEIRELSVRKIDDKKIQKLLDIYIDPKLTTSEIEIDKATKEKSVKKKNFNIAHIQKIEENILLSGEQGSGKTKILNTIACRLATAENITNNKSLPIRIKAPVFKDNEFDVSRALITETKKLAELFYKEGIFELYKPIIFIDDIDLLKNSEKEILIANVKDYCEKNKTYYVLTYRKNEFDYDKGIKTVRIHNFNSKQVEAFVAKYFEGSDRGEKFIKILRESDILSKLPTTPLTITLISLLYDENNFEIPATLSDIYTDFSSILLGKLEIKNRTDLLIFNLKRRLFTALALKMLDAKRFDIPYDEFTSFINEFLDERGYQTQNNEEIIDIIEKSGMLYKDDYNMVGFKQQAFVEFMASLEIYHHARDTHYDKLVTQFNDVIWQSTAIFYAGHSKELTGMIDDVISKAPNNNLKDWFINTGGMGYLAQALYQTRPVERKKLVVKTLDTLLMTFSEMKKLSEDEESYFFEMPLPMIIGVINYWFNENFKSITLKKTLEASFDDIYELDSNFENNCKLLLISSTLLNPYIGDVGTFSKLLDRPDFINHPIFPLVADMILDMNQIDKKTIPSENVEKIEKMISKKREYIKSVIKEPAYRFNNESFALEEKNDSPEIK